MDRDLRDMFFVNPDNFVTQVGSRSYGKTYKQNNLIIEKLQNRINKAIEYMEKARLGELENGKPYYFLDDEIGQDLLKILKEGDE